MYSRDPFNLRRNSPALNILRNNATSFGNRVAQQAKSATETLLEAGRQALEQSQTPSPSPSSSVSSSHTTTMSSYALNGGVTSTADHWHGSGRSRHTYDDQSSIGEKVTGIFSQRKDSLPMYKDKPYYYQGSSGRWVIWLRQRGYRIIGGALLSFILLVYWLGSGSSSSHGSKASTGSKSKSSSSWSLFGSRPERINWDEKAELVKDAFKISWAGYEKYGWGYDEYHPVAHSGKQMTPSGMGWIIVDALDTMMLMNLTTELAHARQWIHSNLTYDQDHDVNTFESTIRMLGGLLSAYYLSSSFPGVYAPVKDGLDDDLYLEKAADLADRLLGAYDTDSGIPYASVNLHSSKGIPSHADAGASSTAEATSLQLEMKYLAKLTGETHYWESAEHIMKVVDDNQVQDGLVPIYIYPDTGLFRTDNIRLGSRGDSYYEYLIKQYLQTSREEPIYQDMWNQTLAGMKKHLITYSTPNNFTVLAERQSGLDASLTAKMDHLVCFLPGTIALATTGGLPLSQARQQPSWGPQQDEDMTLAEELMKTCWGMYKIPASGLAPEITYFNVHNPPLMYEDFTTKNRPVGPEFTEKVIQDDDYVIHSNDVHNLQRPETVESLFYMWRITGDEKYRRWGWEMFQAFVKWTAVEDGTGFSSVANVLQTPPGMRDNMESFWLAETLKYFYLLFGSNDVLPLTEVVFNTEAHPFPCFQLGKLFKTGWQRKPAGSAGHAAQAQAQKKDAAAEPAKVAEEVIRVTIAGDALAPTPPVGGGMEAPHVLVG